jgi:hypothetical protein
MESNIIVILQKTHYLTLNGLKLYNRRYVFATDSVDAAKQIRNMKKINNIKNVTYKKQRLDLFLQSCKWKTLSRHTCIAQGVKVEYFQFNADTEFNEHTGLPYRLEAQVNLEIGNEIKMLLNE